MFQCLLFPFKAFPLSRWLMFHNWHHVLSFFPVYPCNAWSLGIVATPRLVRYRCWCQKQNMYLSKYLFNLFYVSWQHVRTLRWLMLMANAYWTTGTEGARPLIFNIGSFSKVSEQLPVLVHSYAHTQMLRWVVKKRLMNEMFLLL